MKQIGLGLKVDTGGLRVGFARVLISGVRAYRDEAILAKRMAVDLRRTRPLLSSSRVQIVDVYSVGRMPVICRIGMNGTQTLPDQFPDQQVSI